MVILLLDTGLRISEACSIQIANINLGQLEILVDGKGGKQRIVPISPFTASLLNGWLDIYKPVKWLFPANNANGYWDKTSLEKTMRLVCRINNIRPITPHCLRHFFATHNLKYGARLDVISKILGHASTAITADIYVHVDRDDIHNTHRSFSPLTGYTAEIKQLGKSNTLCIEQ